MEGAKDGVKEEMRGKWEGERADETHCRIYAMQHCSSHAIR